MAMQQLTLPGEIVKKHNDLVRSKIHIADAQASRILASLIACIRADDTKFADSYSLSIKDFMTDTSGRSYKNIKAACKELLYAHAEIESHNGSEEKLRLIPFFREISYHKGIVSAQFNPNMSGLLLQLKACFTEFNILEYLTLPSIYSQRLFEILKSWANVGSGEILLSVKELHRLLDTPPSFRADFKAFRIRVLEKAHKDIHAKTKLRFEWEPVKAGRSVEAIRFSFGPGRRAIAEAETKKAIAEKQRRLKKNRWIRAYNCALGKAGDCSQQENKPIICKVCLEYRFCEDLRKNGGKSFDPTT